MRLEARRCRACSARWEEFVDKGVRTFFDNPEKVADACPLCGRQDQIEGLIAGVGNVSNDLRGYPYFDYALGMRLESASHRQAVMRERGLVEGLSPAEQRDRIDRESNHRAELARQDEINDRELEARQRAQPWYQGYARLRERGAFSTENIARSHRDKNFRLGVD